MNFIMEIDKRQESIMEQKEQLKRIEEEASMSLGNIGSISRDNEVACACGQINQAGAKFCVKCGSAL